MAVAPVFEKPGSGLSSSSGDGKIRHGCFGGNNEEGGRKRGTRRRKVASGTVGTGNKMRACCDVME